MATFTALDWIPGFEGDTGTALDLMPGGVGGLFGGGDVGGYGEARRQLEQIPEEMKPYYEPYIQAGTQSLGSLQEQLSRMTQDPSALMAQLGAGYQQSPGYQFSVDQAIEAANRAAAAGGQLGAPGVQAAVGQQVQGMAQQDFGDYLNRILGLYGGGVSGLTGLSGLGAQEGAGLAENLARARMSEAGLGQAEAQTQAQGQGQMISGLASMLPLLMMAM